jgi:hypothetical protein
MEKLSIYDKYALHGVDQYYKKFSKSYYNPHEDKIKKILDDILQYYLHQICKLLDFACGDGLISKYVNNKYKNIIVKGSDPYFDNQYCNYNFSFDDIICGKLLEHFDIVICCYAYHLLSDNKRYDFLTQLSMITKKFVIISPSKKIKITHPLWNVVENKRIDKITIIVLEINSF